MLNSVERFDPKACEKKRLRQMAPTRCVKGWLRKSLGGGSVFAGDPNRLSETAAVFCESRSRIDSFDKRLCCYIPDATQSPQLRAKPLVALACCFVSCLHIQPRKRASPVF